MADLTIKHNFQSAKPQGADATLVGSNEWNAEHQLLGELPIEKGGTGASNAADARTNLDIPATGDVDTVAADLAAHIADTSGAHAATAISFNPAAGIAATEVQAAIEEDAGDLAAHIADTSGAHNASAIDYAQTGTGAVTRSVQAKLREKFVVTDYSTIQQAINATGATPGRILKFPPGDYSLVGLSTLNFPADIIVEGKGARIYDDTVHKILAILAGRAQFYGLAFEGAGGTYDADGYGVYLSGTLNGAGVAPTMLEGPFIFEECSWSNFGNRGFQALYARDIRLESPRFRDIAYGSCFGYSVEEMHVYNPDIDGMTGETDSGELNAYGIAYTSEGGVSDFVRYPRSVNCSARGGRIRNIPTWHALDTHGGDKIVFDDFDIIDCAVAVTFTHLTESGTTNSTMSNIRARNTLTGDNPSGFPKSGSAIWSFGSPTSRSYGNVIKDITIFGHGDPTAAEGAIQIEHDVDGVCENVTIIEPHSCAISFNGDMDNFSLSRCTIIDPRNVGTAGGGATDNPQYVRFMDGGTYHKITLSKNTFIRRNTGVDNFVGQIGIFMPNDADKDIRLYHNVYDGVVTPYSIPDVTGVTFADYPTYSTLLLRPQTVAGSLATAFTTTSSTDTSTGLSAAITPRSSSSQILVRAALVLGADFWNTGPRITIYRNGTQVWPSNGTTKAQYKWLADTENNTDFIVGSVAITFLDSPASASTQTYVVRLASSNNTNNVHLNRDNNGTTVRGESNIVLEEII